MENTNPKAFLEYLLVSLLGEESGFSLDERQDELGTLFQIQVYDEDMGKLIGKNGQTIQALRTLLRVIGSQRQERINIKVLEPYQEEGSSESFYDN